MYGVEGWKGVGQTRPGRFVAETTNAIREDGAFFVILEPLIVFACQLMYLGFTYIAVDGAGTAEVGALKLTCFTNVFFLDKCREK